MTEKTVETLSDELSQVLQEIVTNPEEEPKRAVVVDEKTILVDEVHYQIIEDYRNGFNIEAFNERYNDIFERYDYIVGDWGHEKLRLKGFFKHSHKLATPDRDIDYLQEYPIYNKELEDELCKKLVRKMLEVDSPREQYSRLGLEFYVK